MNNWNNQYSYNNWDRPSTNIQYCASLEDALARCNRPNTENVFFHQDLSIFYRIKVDFDGKKYWQEFSYSSNQTDNTPVVKQDLKYFEDRLSAIENLLFRKENSTNEQSDGQVSISINNDASAVSVSRS